MPSAALFACGLAGLGYQENRSGLGVVQHTTTAQTAV